MMHGKEVVHKGRTTTLQKFFLLFLKIQSWAMANDHLHFIQLHYFVQPSDFSKLPYSKTQKFKCCTLFETRPMVEAQVLHVAWDKIYGKSLRVHAFLCVYVFLYVCVKIQLFVCCYVFVKANNSLCFVVCSCGCSTICVLLCVMFIKAEAHW